LSEAGDSTGLSGVYPHPKRVAWILFKRVAKAPFTGLPAVVLVAMDDAKKHTS